MGDATTIAPYFDEFRDFTHISDSGKVSSDYFSMASYTFKSSPLERKEGNEKDRVALYSLVVCVTLATQ